MINVRTLHNEVRFNINLLNADFDQAVRVMDIDAALNRAKDYIIQNYSFLSERSKYFEECLRELEIPDRDLVKVGDKDKYAIFKLPADYYTYLQVLATGKKGECSAEIWNSQYKSTNKISLNDPNFSPDFFWRRGLYNIVGTNIHYYHNGDYSVQSLKMSYIKILPDVQNPSESANGFYEKADGEVLREDKHLMISSTALWRKITELAAFYILKARVSSFNGTIEQILFHDSIATNVQL